MSRWLRLLLLVLGAGLFAWFAWSAGPAEIARALGELSWRAPIILLPYALVYAFDTGAWAFAFKKDSDHGLGPWTLARIRLVGESLNNVVPPTYLSGEPIKIYLAHKHGAPVLETASSVVVAKSSMILAQVLFISIATIAAATLVPPGSGYFIGFCVVTAGALGVVILLFWLQRRGMFIGLLDLLRRCRLRIRALESRREHFAELDRSVVRFYRDERPRLVISTALHFLGWIVGALEVWLITWLLPGARVSFAEALAIESFAHVAKGIGLFVPGSLGVQESGIVLLFHVFGLSEPVGVSYAILRRAREVFFALLGGALLFVDESSYKALARKIATGPQESP